MPNQNYTRYNVTREDLVALALGGGIRGRIQEIERELRRYQKMFPQVFVSTEPIVLLAAEPRTDGQAWPLTAPPEKPKRPYTKTGRFVARQAQKASAKGAPAWHTMHACLLHAPKHQATTKEIHDATAMTGGHIADQVTRHPQIFKRVKPGVFRLTAKGVKLNLSASHTSRVTVERTGGRVRRADIEKMARGELAWQKMQQALLAAPNQTARARDIQRVAGITSVNVSNAFTHHPELFKRVSQGVYTLTAAGKNGSEPQLPLE